MIKLHVIHSPLYSLETLLSSDLLWCPLLISSYLQNVAEFISAESVLLKILTFNEVIEKITITKIYKFPLDV